METNISKEKAVANNGESTGKLLGGITGKGFMPKQSGNPSGRPKKTIITEAYQELLPQLKPGDPQKRTYAMCLAEAQMNAACDGDTKAAKEITDRTEGQARQFIETKNVDEFLGWTPEQKMEYAITGKRPTVQ